MKKLVVCLLLLCLSLGLCACGGKSLGQTGGTELEQLCAKATTVAFSDAGAEIKGPGARFENGVLTISTGGAASAAVFLTGRWWWTPARRSRTCS